MSELKKCPFCGGEAEFCNYKYHIGKRIVPEYWVGCSGCGVITFYYKTKQQAITAWNNRKEQSE